MGKRIYLSPPHMGTAERELLGDAFDSNWIAPLGPHVDAFEREFAETVQVPHAAALSSGTAALHLALILLGVGHGDEVFAPTLTFSATVNPILYQGATPVLIDSDRKSWNMDPNLLDAELRRRARINKLPKAVIVVDIYGQCAEWEPIANLCKTYDIPLVEDAAEALGATYRGKPAGGFGDIGIFSFNGNKIITTSGGGMLVSAHEPFVEKARFLATQARDTAAHYQHSQVGFNYRMSNLLAAVGRGQLKVLEQRVAARRSVQTFYRSAFAGTDGLEFMPDLHGARSNAWLTCVLVHPRTFGVAREAVRAHLESLNIESRPVWKPMHLQPIFRKYPVVGGAVAEELFDLGLCLPSGSSLTEADLHTIAAAVRSVPRQSAIAAAAHAKPALSEGEPR